MLYSNDYDSLIPISADLFIFEDFLILFKMEKSRFVELAKISLKNFLKLVPNKFNNSLEIFDNQVFKIESLKIFTESYASLVLLIDNIVTQNKIKTKL